MRTIETDYLVVGAGATGMAFTDALIAESDARVVMVDRRHQPGGHWNDGYPFLRLHTPSAIYGVLYSVSQPGAYAWQQIKPGVMATLVSDVEFPKDKADEVAGFIAEYLAAHGRTETPASLDEARELLAGLVAEEAVADEA
jgi:glycine/D-amino acid oxidase-like deaminating enzyme